jgi:hypothetical protein
LHFSSLLDRSQDRNRRAAVRDHDALPVPHPPQILAEMILQMLDSNLSHGPSFVATSIAL